jgi:hypothetical protein
MPVSERVIVRYPHRNNCLNRGTSKPHNADNGAVTQTTDAAWFNRLDEPPSLAN